MKAPKITSASLVIIVAILLTGASILYGFESPDPPVPLDPTLGGQRIRATITVYYEAIAAISEVCTENYNMHFSLWVRDTEIIISDTVNVCDPFNYQNRQQDALGTFMSDSVYVDTEFCIDHSCTGGITSLVGGAFQWEADPRVTFMDIRFVVNQP